MNRPVPVVLSAIFLGLFAALQLLFTGTMAAGGFLYLSKSLPAPPPSPFSPSFLPAMMFALSLVFAAIAVWSIVTLIGLVRLRSWARYSILVIAGCITFFGGTATLATLAMPLLISSVPTQTPAANPHTMHATFLFVGAIYGLFTAIGIALLVYYNLARTRTLFLQNAPVNQAPPNTSTGRPRPTAIAIISWFYLLSAPCCLFYLFFPIPGFLFGFIFYGIAARLLYLAFGVLAFVLGYGLYRLWNWARLAVFAWFGVGLFNALVLLTPWGRSRYHTYMDAFNAHMYTYPGQQPPPNLAASPVFIGVCTVIGLAFCAFILWLLHRHREAFTPTPPAPPLSPPDPLPLAG
ncbi:MAG: hypothetical protein ABSG84_00220 [Acidobacteriaceae bacterium]|jgi:hypothetical protein